MDVDVIHGLTSVTAGVQNEAVAVVGKALLLSDLYRGCHQSAKQVDVGSAQIARVAVVQPRQDEQMGRRLGIDIADRHGIIV